MIKISSNNNTIRNDYPYQISIDTMELTAKLKYSELSEIQNYFDYDKSSKSEARKHYKGVFHLKQYGFTMKIEPQIRQWKRHYNARITLQTSFFESEYIPFSIMEIIQMFDWSISDIHIAFDFLTDVDLKSFTYKHHGNIKHNLIGEKHQSFYLGSRKNGRKNNVSINYDRNEKEHDRNVSDTARHKFSNRFETRLTFKIGELSLHDIDHSKIVKELDKRIFIADIESDNIHEYDKRSFRALRKNYNKIDDYNKKKKAHLKEVAISNKQDLSNIYLENVDNLFAPFNASQPKELYFFIESKAKERKLNIINR